jgi:hypothetical protein
MPVTPGRSLQTLAPSTLSDWLQWPCCRNVSAWYWLQARESRAQSLSQYPYGVIIVLGHPHYYSRFGCSPAKTHGIVEEQRCYQP